MYENNSTKRDADKKYKEYQSDKAELVLPDGAFDRLSVLDLLNDTGSNNTFTRHLRSLMHKHNFDTRMISDCIGVNQRTIQRYQNSDYEMDLTSMQLKSFLGLAALFGDDFLGGTINWGNLKKFLEK